MDFILKKIILILIFAVLASCNSTNKEQKIVYYPYEDAFANPEFLVPIDLDTTSLKYWDIAMMTPANDYRKNIPYFQIKNDSVIKRIVPFLIEPPFVKRNEVITITMNSIFADKEYAIEELDDLLTSIYENENKPEFSNYQKHPNLIRLAIDIDTNSTGKDLKKILIKTTDSFENLKKQKSDSITLIIYFDNLIGLYGIDGPKL